MSSGEDVLDEVFASLFLDWAEGNAPADSLEGVHPHFAGLFGQSATDFTFDQFRHVDTRPGWAWQSIGFPSEGEGALLVYRPDAWSNIRQKGPAAQLLTEADIPRQSMLLTTGASWAPGLRSFCERAAIMGFDFRPLSTGRSRWVFATRGDSGYWCWGAYHEKEWVVVVKGDAADRTELEEQLGALMTGNPWGWAELGR